MTPAQKIAWAILLLALICAGSYFVITSPLLPPLVAVHFDAAGDASSFMAKDRYRWLVYGFGLAFPVAITLAMTAGYSTTNDLRLPHREYWMAPAQVAATRAFLKVHAIWFGVLLVLLMCFLHHLILVANLTQPPQLSNQRLLVGVVVLLAGMSAWIGTLMRKFRRPG